MEARKIIYCSKGKKEFLNKLYENKIFGLDSRIDNRIQAIFIAALGVEEPVDLPSRVDGGWFRTENIVTAKDRMFVSCFKLGECNNDEEIEESIKPNNYYDYFEKCIEGGFRRIEKLVEEKNWDNDLIEAFMLDELDSMFEKNVKKG